MQSVVGPHINVRQHVVAVLNHALPEDYELITFTLTYLQGLPHVLEEYLSDNNKKRYSSIYINPITSSDIFSSV